MLIYRQTLQHWLGFLICLLAARLIRRDLTYQSQLVIPGGFGHPAGRRHPSYLLFPKGMV
jgi:hypothetical protein